MKPIRSDDLCWAIERANKLFDESVVQLLKQHPLDSADEDGEPFWCGWNAEATQDVSLLECLRP